MVAESMVEAGAGLVTRHDKGAITVLEVDAPPVNALDAVLRQALLRAIADAAADSKIAAIVLSAQGPGFPALDLAMAEDATDTDELSELCEAIEGMSKPVVVALHGPVTSGGLALALAARGRVAHAGAMFGLPEVTLGLLPAAGVTQRLPRLIGAEQTLRLALTGQPVKAAEALALGLLDRVVEDGLTAAALDLAQQLVANPGVATSDRRDGMRDPATYQKAINTARSRVKAQTGRAARLPAPARIIDCVEAAYLLPFAAGLFYESAARDDLATSPEAAGLRHALHAERRAAHFAETRLHPRPELRALTRVGILGASAADLALPLLQAGCEVALVDPKRPQLVQALEKVAALQERAIAEGRMSAAQRDLDWARLGTALSVAGLAECQAVLIADVELMPEAMEATSPGTLLAMIGRGGVQPQDRGGDILGFRPAGARLVELVVTPITAPPQVLQAQVLARLLGLSVLRSAMPGGVPGRVMAAGRAAVAHMLSQGEAPADLAVALVEFGLPGLVPQIATKSEQPAPRPAPATARRIEARVLGAMANEGARLLGQGLVSEAAEIDFALIAGQGFPRWQGGPMFWADRRGLMILRRDLEIWGAEAPEIWGIAPLLAELAGRGGRFATLG